MRETWALPDSYLMSIGLIGKNKFYLVAALLAVLAIGLHVSLAQPQDSANDTINPKRITEAVFHILKSGTIKVSGGLASANLTISVPQKGIESLKVIADKWKFINDSNGNTVLLLEWGNSAGDLKYSVDMSIRNSAVYTPMKKIGSGDSYLKANSQITFNDKMRDVAFPYSKSLEKAAELAMFVHNYIKYDLSLVGESKPSDWVMDNKRGVCVEYANLLSSLLKISGIPSRYVVGYAYSSVENKLVGHAWVEILAEDGTWIPLDPTWNEAGYLDATHVATAYQQDSNQTETFTYTTSGGKAEWARNPDTLELADYSESDVSQIKLRAGALNPEEKGYIIANITTGTCMISELRLNSCAGEDATEVLAVYSPAKEIFSCGNRELYWFFNVSRGLQDGFMYSCPVKLYSQTGSLAERPIVISGRTKTYGTPSISGPGTAATGQTFSLFANSKSKFIFYNDALGIHEDTEWALSFSKPSDSTFYLYSEGGLDVKTIKTAREREFNVDVLLPENATEGSNVTVSVRISNVAGSARAAAVTVAFGEATKKQTVTTSSGSASVANFTFIGVPAGRQEVHVSVIGNGIYTYDSVAEVTPLVPAAAPGTDILTGILSAILSFLHGIFG